MFKKILSTVRSSRAQRPNDATKNDKCMRVKTKAKSCRCVPHSCKCKYRNAIKLLAQQRYRNLSNDILVYGFA